ncbi:MAG: hypothetical protein K0R46_714 [Herbinix sp.]|nr:hypothetical protein [Herbinix sp.]
MVKKIVLVFKTHFDIGFTDLSSRVIDKYADSMLKEVIATCNATQHMGELKYVWTMPAWPLKIIMQRCSDDLKKDLELLIERGQVVWHALPFTSHTDFCSAEEYIEGLRYGRELSEHYHKPYPISAKMTDVPGHGIMLPQILSGAGVKFLHLGCNEFATPPKLPFLFRWQSPSGEQVLTMYSKGGYGTSLLPPEDWEFPVWMALMQTQDNCGPQTVEVINKLVKDIRNKYPEAEIICGTMDDFYEELVKSDLSKLPLVTKDLADTWIHGIGAYPKEVSMVREAREVSKRLQALRMKQHLESETVNSDDYTTLLDQYYEDINLFDEHTWGADVKTWLGSKRVYRKKDFLKAKQKDNYKFMERSWQEQRDRATNSVQTIHEVKLRIDEKCGNEISLFNPNSCEYTGWVSLKSLDRELSGCSIICDNRHLPVTRIDGEWSCFVTKLPPFITVPIHIADGHAYKGKLSVSKSEQQVVIENHRYRLTLSEKTGDISELYDKGLDTILLQQTKNQSVFSYRYDRYGIKDVTKYLKDYAYRFSTWGIQDYGREAYPECEHRTYYPSFQSYSIELDTLVLCYENRESTEKYGDAEKVIIEITLPPDGDEIFIHVRLQNKRETPFIESGSFLFPAACQRKDYRVNKSNTVLDPTSDIEDNANHVLYCLENYISSTDGECGVCIVAKDTPLVALGDTGIYKYMRSYKAPEEPVLHFNLFNNMWGTNFPQWIGGDLNYRYILYGYRQEQETDNLERAVMLQEGIELTGCSLNKDCIKLPEHMQLINVREGKDGLIIRLKELSGRTETRKLRIDGYTIVPVDLNNVVQGEGIQETFEFDAKPYGIYSFLLKKR